MPRPSIAAERREEILEAFETCALRKGLAATTLKDVAEEAGLPRPLVRHFMGNRAELVAGLTERMVQRAIDAVEQAINAAGELSAEDTLRIVLHQSFADPITNRLMIQLWQQSWQDQQLNAQLEDVYQRCLDLIHDRLFLEATRETRDSVYALTAMALGSAVLKQFNINPSTDAALVEAGQAIKQLPAAAGMKRKPR